MENADGRAVVFHLETTKVAVAVSQCGVDASCDCRIFCTDVDEALVVVEKACRIVQVVYDTAVGLIFA